ncbi:MAG: nitroreductase family protein [Candidatus Coatesbacteria bacterium]|nr:MAG: nitroreductase family protein [Candidatus Coatesbacteria bacterium]
MDVLEAILGRRSIRRFLDEPLEEGQIEKLLEAARWAPSGGNMQPWRFVVVANGDVKKQLAADSYGQRFVAEAPVVIGVLAVPEESAKRYGDRGRLLYSIQDTAAAVQNVLLAAYGMGLGTCWVGAFDDEAVAKTLACRSGEVPVALIPVGWPAEDGGSSRRGLNEIVRYLE